KYYDAHTKLEWQCEKGHKWLTKPSCILRGHWYPFCQKYK
ncbi:2143_t:CDS:1, partial [Cetraspora pellucida]